ncbi:hypothetical protein Tco_0660146 [Tanacetum coccineum]
MADKSFSDVIISSDSAILKRSVSSKFLSNKIFPMGGGAVLDLLLTPISTVGVRMATAIHVALKKLEEGRNVEDAMAVWLFVILVFLIR